LKLINKRIITLLVVLAMLCSMMPMNAFADNDESSTATQNPFAGKIISILGDSISTFAGYIPVADGFNLEHLSRYPDAGRIPDVTVADQTWWMQIINELGAKLGINDSWRGATVSGAVPVTTGTTGENAAMGNLVRIQNLGSNGTPDVILFYGGTNDLAHVAKVGTFDATTAPTEVDLTTKKWDNLADAYVQTILRLQYYYPDTTIIAMLPTYTASYYSTDKLAQANAVLAQICDYYGVTYVDLRYCGISVNDLPDGIHPGTSGMDYITESVIDVMMNKCEMEAGENVVHSVTHKLTGAESSRGYYKGVTHGKSFVTTITGEDVKVSVTMSGADITETVYANGVVTIEEVTGDIVITAEGRVKTVYDDYIQLLPENICFKTNLWAALEHDKKYYTVNGWGIHSSGTVYSVTIPINADDRIYATSFGSAGKNGGGINGIRVTWFDENGVLKSVSADQVYAEFASKGYLAVPQGAAAVNIPMWKVSDDNEIYILNRNHTYESVVTMPTCESAGYTTYTCACGDTYTDNGVVALGHDIVVDEAVAPTCTDTGLTKGSHCTRCDEETVAQKTVPAKGHSYKDGACTSCGAEDPSAPIPPASGGGGGGAIIIPPAGGGALPPIPVTPPVPPEEIVTDNPETEGVPEETITAKKEAVKDIHLKLRSANVKTSKGKKAIKLTVSEVTDTGIELDGYVIYRSTKKTSGYKKIYTTKTGAYYNTSAKKGVKYYYKAKGFVTIDGEKVYTGWSKKAIRTAK